MERFEIRRHDMPSLRWQRWGLNTKVGLKGAIESVAVPESDRRPGDEKVGGIFHWSGRLEAHGDLVRKGPDTLTNCRQNGEQQPAQDEDRPRHGHRHEVRSHIQERPFIAN
jgi:hypothetical protein